MDFILIEFVINVSSWTYVFDVLQAYLPQRSHDGAGLVTISDSQPGHGERHEGNVGLTTFHLLHKK